MKKTLICLMLLLGFGRQLLAQGSQINALTNVFYIAADGNCSNDPCTSAIKRLCRNSVSDVHVYACNTSTGFYTALTATAAPGGSDTQVQFNDSAAMGGDAGLLFDKTSNALSLGGPLVSGTAPTYNEIVVDPRGTTGAYTLQGAIDYVRSRSTLTNRWTIRILPGLMVSDNTIDATALTGVVFVGYGADQTIIGASKTWLTSHASGGNTLPGFFDVSSCNDVTIQGLTINGQYGDDGTIGLTSNAPSGVKHDTMLGNLFIRNADIYGTEYAMSAGTNANAGVRADLFNSRLFGCSNTIRSGAEKWHIFASDLRATKTDTCSSQTQFISGLQFLGAGEFQVWGSHIHGEDRRTCSGSTTGPSAGIRTSQIAGQVSEVIGSTIHVMVMNDSCNTSNRFGAVDIGASATSNLLIVGCDLIYETMTMTQGVIGGVTMASSSTSSSTVRITGSNIRDNGGSGGTQRGWLARAAGAIPGAGGTVDVSGSRYLDGLSVPSTQINLIGNPSTSISGSATLASGTKIVLLLTDSGNVGGATDATFAASATVTVTDSTLYRPGKFVKAASHADTAWTRIKNIPNSTTLTLEETYRGGALATTQGKLGTPSVNTQNDSVYRVTPNCQADEVFNVMTLSPAAFVINSSNTASTAVCPWQVTR